MSGSNEPGLASQVNGSHKSFPPPPKASVAWNELGFGRERQVNGHIECHWKIDTQKWSEPVFVENSELRISGFASGLNYGMQAFEGMKAVRDPSGQIRLFRPDLHAARMQHSCEVVSIPPIPKDHFVRCVSLAVALNAEFVPPSEAPAMLYVRPLAFGSSGQLNIYPPDEYTFCVYVNHTSAILGNAVPVSALVSEDFDRAATRGTGSAKIGGNYAPVMRWQRRAKEEGFGLLLHLDSRSQTEIEEFSAAGFIGVQKSSPVSGTDAPTYTLIVPTSAAVIKSIVTTSSIELAKSLGWNVTSRPVKYDEIETFDEVLAVGTAATVVPIKSITRKSRDETITIGQGCSATNTAFRTLLDKLLESQRGIGSLGAEWAVVVKPPAEY